ncbi:MAG: MBL fold metallo-hydrolase [Geminicoccaceae bacterium]|nr:MAG: MBL fold metallo-hydrolase [Geminicoccaceae bacterium]
MPAGQFSRRWRQCSVAALFLGRRARGRSALFLPVVEPWFALEALDPTILKITEPHTDPLIRANLFLVRGRERDLLIDGGNGIVPLRPFLSSRLTKPVVALCTHAHVDHVGAIHEFEERLVHPLEAEALAHPAGDESLFFEDFPLAFRQMLQRIGYRDVPPLMITALPDLAYDPGSYRLVPTPATRLVDDGDVVETGDRHFEVLHLPGHSPGQIGLFEPRTGILFGGDAIYDGTLLADGPGMSLGAYVRTLERLLALDVTVVHGGHGASFDRLRLHDLCRDHLARWRA